MTTGALSPPSQLYQALENACRALWDAPTEHVPGKGLTLALNQAAATSGRLYWRPTYYGPTVCIASHGNHPPIWDQHSDDALRSGHHYIRQGTWVEGALQLLYAPIVHPILGPVGVIQLSAPSPHVFSELHLKLTKRIGVTLALLLCP